MPRGIALDNVFSSEPVYAGQKVSYTAHATTTFSVGQAIDVLDIIGSSTDSDDCLPFAMNIVDDGEVVSIGEDNGEFGIGELLAKALQDLHGYNTLVCVSRKVSGMYVTEMVQPVKAKVIKIAVNQALGSLYQYLVKRENERDQIDALRTEMTHHAGLTDSSRDLLNLRTAMESASLGSTNNNNNMGGEGEVADNAPRKQRPQGSGPGGRETIFERTERQARERHEKEMQILLAKKLLQANRPLFVPKTKSVMLPDDIKAYNPNEGKGPAPRDEEVRSSKKAAKRVD